MSTRSIRVNADGSIAHCNASGAAASATAAIRREVKTAAATSGGSVPPSRPTAPPATSPVVLQDQVKLRQTGVTPTPLPPSGAGFPKAQHRSVRKYVPKAQRSAGPIASVTDGKAIAGHTSTTDPATSVDMLNKWNEGQVTDFNFDNAASDPLLDKALEDQMRDQDSIIAASAVLLRSRSVPQRSGCLARLLAWEGLAELLADTDATVAAQFILALRLALDAQNVVQQSDVISVVSLLTHRENEFAWHQLLEATSDDGLVPPLSSWYEERTLYGVGEAVVTQVSDPTQAVPTAQVWEPIESLHELSSVVKCDILESFAKTQYSTRLRYLLANPSDAVPWVPHTILTIFKHLSLSKTASAALSAAPSLIETLTNIITPCAAADASLAQVTEPALHTLNNLAKGSIEAARIISDVGAFASAVAIVQAIGEVTHELTAWQLSVCQAALRLLRTSIFLNHSTADTVPNLFGSLCLLARLHVVEAILLIDAHCATHSLLSAKSGLQENDPLQVGFLDFAVRDCPAIAATLLEKVKAGDSASKSKAFLFASAATSLLAHAVRAMPVTVSLMENVSGAMHALAVDGFEVERNGINFPLALCKDYDVSPKSRPSAPRWPELTDQEELRVARTRYHFVFLRLCSLVGDPSKKLVAALASSARAFVSRVQGCVTPLVVALSKQSGNRAYRHACLPKRDSRIHSSILKSEIELVVTLLCSEMFAADEKNVNTTARAVILFNLTVYLQPTMGRLFTEILETVIEKPKAALLHYLKGTYIEEPLSFLRLSISVTDPAGTNQPQLNDENPALQGRGVGGTPALYTSYRPGRLEPQVEWIFAPAADVPEDEAVGRMLRVKTRRPVTPAVLLQWAAWVSSLASGYGNMTFLANVDWREAALRCAGVFASCSSHPSVSSSVYQGLTDFLKWTLRRRHEPHASNWTSRLGEPPLTALNRALHVYEHEAGGDATFSALCLVFLHPGFPENFSNAVLRVLAAPQLCHLAGTCFGARSGDGDRVASLFMGLPLYLGNEFANDEQARDGCRMLSARGEVNPANVLHLRCVHQLAQYLFEDTGELSFTAADLLGVLSPSALRNVTLYDPRPPIPIGEIEENPSKVIEAYLATRLRDTDFDEYTRNKRANVQALNLSAYRAAFLPKE
ncbi:hypothetical protein DIPPA_25257 [Diplonema papillatum]|nr:hypothetical protein DIPPA_25257 [Diplonema papillatum]